MTWWLPSVTSNIPGMSWDDHYPNTLPSKKVVLKSFKHKFSPIVHHNLSLWTCCQHWTDLLHIAGSVNTPSTCCRRLLDSSLVVCACWQTLIQAWLQANCIFFKTFHFIWLYSFSPCSQHQVRLHKHLNHVRVDSTPATCLALWEICQQPGCSSNADYC
jgi:hypothetical protein